MLLYWSLTIQNHGITSCISNILLTSQQEGFHFTKTIVQPSVFLPPSSLPPSSPQPSLCCTGAPATCPCGATCRSIWPYSWTCWWPSSTLWRASEKVSHPNPTPQPSPKTWTSDPWPWIENEQLLGLLIYDLVFLRTFLTHFHIYLYISQHLAKNLYDYLGVMSAGIYESDISHVDFGDHISISLHLRSLCMSVARLSWELGIVWS